MVAQTRTPSTKDQILRAARFVVQRDGVADLSIRAVAAKAGVNLALVHYHFHSRDGLLLAVLEDLDAELLARQHKLYDRPDASLADNWRQAVEYYRQDLESGYVRVLFELAAHGYANPQMAERVRTTMRGWQLLIHDVVEQTLKRLNVDVVDVDSLTSVLMSFWYGVEFRHMLNVPEAEGHLWRTFDTLATLIERLEQKSGET